MTIRYQLSEREVVRGLLRDNRLSTWRILSRLGVVVIGVLFIVLSKYRPDLHAERNFSLGCIFVFLGSVVAISGPIYKRVAYTKYVHDNSAIFTGSYQVTINERGLLFDSSEIKSELAWSLFKKLSEDGEYFYLYGQSRQRLSMMPKRAFSAADLEEFHRFCHSLPRA